MVSYLLIPLNCWFRAAPRWMAQVVGLSFYAEHSGAAAMGYILGYNKDQPPLRFLPVKSEFSSGNSFACPPVWGSRMNPSVKSEWVRDSFCLRIFGESVTCLTASLPKSLNDDPVQVSRYVCQDEPVAEYSPNNWRHWPGMWCYSVAIRRMSGHVCQRRCSSFHQS